MTGPFRPGPPPAGRPGPPPVGRPGQPSAGRPGPVPAGSPGPSAVVGFDDDVDDVRHPAVDAAVRAMANAEGLPPADQIAQYEAAYQTLRETLATIDQA
ncbi:hypothetical protein GA0070216_1368 [Micromonospora matsumotoense]|uniref:Uncharacterized protein n=1 Tax=Micromonospora matsumotoense TaxID=121616 RepID=A0A1C5AWM7_9ACTN|nr:hypothetical protein [Micromonospora matsumotoense]SCF49583.1 hypothetical protein GA0070216_1368 [Micromonospora matsumotoense]